MHRSLLLFVLPLLLSVSACAQPPASERHSALASETLRFDPSGWETDFSRASVPLGEFISGGPPRDGIPPIDDPKFVSVEDAAEWIRPEEPVIALTVNGDTRAYPLQVLIWHEIVNDEVGGEPVAVTFCPLCYAVVVFERPEVDGERLTFGTTGNLRHSDLVMWDRQTESWWQQFSGEALVGELMGQTLPLVPSSLVGFETFRQAHPEARVLSRETGHRRAYGQNPYPGYDDVDRPPFLEVETDGRLAPMARVVGVLNGEAGRAFQLGDLRERRVIHDTLGGDAIAVWWQSGTASAMDARQVGAGRDIGATGAFRRTLDGRMLTFEPAAGGFTDRETGSTWDVFGTATAGPLSGARLEALPRHDVYWFVWSTFRTDGDLYAAP